MSGDPTLLVIWHSRTSASEQMARAASDHGSARLMRAKDVAPQDLLDSQGYLFVCPENLGSLSGEMKEMFDCNYYPVIGRIEGRPYASIIAAGTDGQGAQRQIDKIVTGWRLKRVAEPVIVNFDAQTSEQILAKKSLSDNVLRDCRDLGQALAEGLLIGAF